MARLIADGTSQTLRGHCTRSAKSGPYEGDGNHDVLFNNKRCVVVGPGIVEAILEHMKPIAEYKRDGNLHLSEFTMSGFARPDQES